MVEETELIEAPKPPPVVMTPFGDRVVLKVQASVSDRPSTIILPDGARVNRAAPLIADVIDVGELVGAVQPGMRVLIAALADGVDVTVPGQGSIRIIGERDIIACLSAERPLSALIAERERVSDMIDERVAIELRKSKRT